MGVSSASTLTRVILTGEYPPQPGGVSDYTFRLARCLAKVGERVVVFAPACSDGREIVSRDGAVSVHRLRHGYLPAGLWELANAIDALPRPRRLLVQYVPHAFGLKAMNVPFCLWLAARKKDAVDVMFHEVAFPWGLGRPLRHSLLGAVTRMMAALLIRASSHTFVSTLAWEPVLRGLGLREEVILLPIPSTMPAAVDPVEAREVRRRVASPEARLVIGHVSKHLARPVAPLVASALGSLLDGRPDRVAILVGGGTQEFANALAEAHPMLQGRLRACGYLAPETAAPFLAACDVLLQPYPDGVTTRRTSFMAGLALGVPVVSNLGALTEPFWHEEHDLALAADAAGIVSMAEALLEDPELRARVGAAGARLYQSRFSLERSVEVLRQATATFR